MARVWDLVQTTPEDAAALADLTEGALGFRLGARGDLIAIPDRPHPPASPDGPFGRFASWFLDASDRRTISPSSSLATSELRSAMSQPANRDLRAALLDLYPGASF